MAESDDGAERSQEPTQKRLEQAQRDGQILTSKEMLVFATLGAGTLALLILQSFGPQAALRWSAQLVLGDRATLDAAMLPSVVSAGWQVLAAALIVAGPVMVAAIAAQAAMGGIAWTPKGYAFKPDKMDPLKGLKRMVSMTALVELGKAVAKVVLLAAVALAVTAGAMPRIMGLGWMTTGDAMGVMADLILRFFFAMTLMLGVIGAADLYWQAHSRNKKLRMTLAEVKREHREDNGSPEQKGKLRRMQMDASRRGARERAALPEVQTASVVVMNPRHFAVALRYLPGVDEAPQIVASGRDGMALQMRDLARRAGVPLLELPPLARALYFTGEIGTQIDPRLYGTVATVLAHVWRIDRGMAEDLPPVDLPPEMQFDVNGRRPAG